MVVGFTTTPVQSVPITTKVVSSNTVHGEVYSIQLETSEATIIGYKVNKNKQS
jgi:hypothetical protein